MHLVIDVGNTNTVFGVYDNDVLRATWRMTTQRNSTSDEIGMFFLNMLRLEGIEAETLEGTIISSVVPPVMYSMEHSIRKYLGHTPIVVTSSMDFDIKITYPHPKEIGADRLVNAHAAYKLYGGPLVIIDFGTATTYCAVTGNGEYIGGAIAPGIKISLDALYQNTAKLPRVEITKPERVIGDSTVHAMQAGMFFSYVGGVDYMVEGFKKELGGQAKVIATGGLARMISESSQTIDTINSKLTLEGLNMLYKNCAK